MIITIGRKPFKGTVIDNVMKNHCGGINIDSCRIGSDARTYKGSGVSQQRYTDGRAGLTDGRGRELAFTVEGRFPANVILSESVIHHLPKATQGHWANAKVTGYGDRIGSGTVEYLGVGEKDQSGGSVAKYFFIVRGV